MKSATASRFCCAIGESERVPELFEVWGETIQNETLADELRLVDADYPAMNDVTLGDETVGLRVEKL